jgi:cytoskeletal protein CcmA (bactofilin family)
MDNNRDTTENSDALDGSLDTEALDGSTSGVTSPVHEESTESNKNIKKPNPIVRLWRALNIYLLIFGLLVIIALAVFAISYLNSRKEPDVPVTALQNLTQEQLAEIAAGDAQVGDPRYVLNVQSDAVFAGSALFRGDLNVAGSLQLGEPLTIPSITVSGTGNLTNIQTETLSVADTMTVQGKVTIQSSAIIRDDLTIGGDSRVEGTLTASKISTPILELTGNTTLNLGSHLATDGSAPSRATGSAVGSGGTSSVSGNDAAGTVNINTGTGTAAGCFAAITFAIPFDSTPAVLITPVGDAAAALEYYITRSATGFSVCTANPAPTGRSFAFDYFVIG